MAEDTTNNEATTEERNEEEMVAEGGAVQESTDPETGADDAEADSQGSGATTDLQEDEMIGEGGAVGDGNADAEPALDVEQDEAPEVETQPVQEVDLESADATEADAEAPVSPEAALGAEPEEAADADYKRRLREYTRELKKLPGSWYIIQSYSGYENKVKTNLDMRIQTLEVEESIYDVVVPIEQVFEKDKNGKKKIVKRKLLPGYVLVRMDLNDAAWSVVRETPGVTSFVGNEGNATPVKHRDVAKFLMPKAAPVDGEATASEANTEGETVIAMPEQEEKPNVAHDFQVGEAVTILSGALASVSATINEIDPETGKIQALVSIFGRETPVELTADQIERIM
ncbi:transcription termination/antitermination protein NusG [Corynebacterium genitalium ATCC 33030]|uniref:Transcription termination/antitermination protein NusG n=2 Tax=Corynebacteriaceae TaxID=1653 RepID=D7WB06_9CORY|nr:MULTISPECIES: transcription termination/antitermination protein NusG [Corynebacterium]EFK55037.1 transcription termination/antitermination factor NusG [Corynebacterium genitalium ATCC 33030]UUA89687.1 transcription termination/antitermination protein NusG [Corynebacterium genitalium ATCC 33030]